MYTQKGKKYVYSVIQANEFIQRGYRCLETGFNSKQRKYYWVFDYNEVQPYYEENERYANNKRRVRDDRVRVKQRIYISTDL